MGLVVDKFSWSECNGIPPAERETYRLRLFVWRFPNPYTSDSAFTDLVSFSMVVDPEFALRAQSIKLHGSFREAVLRLVPRGVLREVISMDSSGIVFGESFPIPKMKGVSDGSG